MGKAKMLPPNCPETASSAERKIFDELANIDIQCTIFHSIGLSEHRRKVYGEIDYVILCEYGVMCLEVKGGGIECTNNTWQYIDRHGHATVKYESPFTQAKDNMYSLRDYIRNQIKSNNNVSNAQFACGVAFPDISFTRKSIDFDEKLIYDVRHTDLSEYIRNVFKYWSQKCFEKNGFSGTRISKDEQNTIAALIRTDFGISLNLAHLVKDTEDRIILLTEEQQQFFETVAENDQLLIRGGAGTGKTVLGIEYAKKMAVSGHSVLFLTYNKTLAAKLAEDCRKFKKTTQTRDTSTPGFIDIANFHQVLARVAKLDTPENIDLTNFYERVVPNAFLEIIDSGENAFEPFDILVMDEGQDLLKSLYISCIEKMLVGGLENGKWCIFMDPNQNLYNGELADCLDYINLLKPTKFLLDINCRNTKQIVEYNRKTTLIDAARTLKIDGIDVIIQHFANDEELKKLLQQTVKDLKKQGIEYGDITLLTQHRFENTPLSSLNVFNSLCSLQQVTETSVTHLADNTIHFSTIHNFKGLESKIVFFVCFESIENSNNRLSTYTAISRARSALYVFRRKPD